MDDQHPLWMPAGSVRAILALAMVAAAIVAYLVEAIPDIPLELLTLVLGFYFGQRSAVQ